MYDYLVSLQLREMLNLEKCTDGRIAPRSGLASKHFIDTGAGVIDADYRGPVRVLLFNHSDVDFSGACPCTIAASKDVGSRSSNLILRVVI